MGKKVHKLVQLPSGVVINMEHVLFVNIMQEGMTVNLKFAINRPGIETVEEVVKKKRKETHTTRKTTATCFYFNERFSSGRAAEAFLREIAWNKE